MKIQELERITGLERASIRYYEREGLLAPKRLENGYREYTEADAELLKKIKLLRRLGLSIEKIRQLQQGSMGLATAAAQQVSYHSSQIDDHKRCRAVCGAIRDDDAEFSSLDAERYLRLLREIRIDDKAMGQSIFQESVPWEAHPWKRYFARWLDYTFWGAIVNFVWIVLLRVRPILMGFWETIFGVAAIALYVPVEALLLYKFGTTPGKYIMGIRLEYIQGGNLPYSEALYRSLRVFTGGVFLGIPFFNMILYIFRYCQLTGRRWRIFARNDQAEGPQDMPWDEDTEIIYGHFDWKRGVAAAVCAAHLSKCKRAPTMTVQTNIAGGNYMKSLFEELGGTYHKKGDYYIPNLIAPDAPVLGIWGHRRRRFLMEHHNPIYIGMLLAGTLNDHLIETDQSAEAMFSQMVAQLAETEQVNEALKASDQMEWISHMRGIRNRATEIVNKELIFV